MLSFEQGPSCTLLDQLSSLNIQIYCNSASIKNRGNVSESRNLHPPMKKQTVLKTKQLRKNLLFPKVYLLSI